MANNDLNCSFVNWFFYNSLNVIINAHELSKESKIEALIKLKEDVGDADISFKRKFMSTNSVKVISLDGPNEPEKEVTNGIENFFVLLSKFLLNAETPQQQKKFNEQIVSIQNDIEDEINNLLGVEKIEIDKTQETILSRNEVILLIECLKKQHFITKTGIKIGKGFHELTGYSMKNIQNGLANQFFDDDEIDKMQKNLYEIIGYLDTLRQ